MSGVAFYCVADERYFLGAVAMINSLRLQGHSEAVYVLDCGLRVEQREILSAHVELVDGRSDIAPWLSKTIAPIEHPAEVMVLIDADMIATRSLEELIEQATNDRVVVFRNDIDRFVENWGELLELGKARRRPYVSSGLMVLSRSSGETVLSLLDDRQRSIDLEQTFARAGNARYPFLYPEQDVLNAVLGAAAADGQLVVESSRWHVAERLPRWLKRRVDVLRRKQEPANE